MALLRKKRTEARLHGSYRTWQYEENYPTNKKQHPAAADRDRRSDHHRAHHYAGDPAEFVISEELMELIGMCDRIIMKDGEISNELPRDPNMDENSLISSMV